MSQFVIAASTLFMLYFAYRWVRQELERVDTSLERTNHRISRKLQQSSLPLYFDKGTGIYLPVGRDAS